MPPNKASLLISGVSGQADSLEEGGQPIPAAPGANLKRDAKPLVLAVDDQRDALRLLQVRLQSAGIDCHTCNDAASALQFLEDNSVDVIFLDVMMPQMDGFELCRRIKANSATEDIPVVFLTAKMETQDKVRGLEVGAHDYLSKPVDQQELLARVRAALRVKQLQDQLKQQLVLRDELYHLHQGMLGQHWQKTLGQLAASLAHEINNPLAAALGSVQLMTMEEGLSPALAERLQVIDQSLQRAGQKLRSLLLIAQTSRQPQKINLAKFTEDLLTVINFQIVVNKVALTTQFESQCSVMAVPSDLARALLYILNNAIEAVAGRPSPAISITISAQPTRACITIRDNGPGIPEDALPKVFQPFFSTKPDHSGVGLYLANSIIKSIGGSITFQFLDSAPGTEVVIDLPECNGMASRDKKD